MLYSGFTQENETTKRRTVQRIDQYKRPVPKLGLILQEINPPYFICIWTNSHFLK